MGRIGRAACLGAVDGDLDQPEIFCSLHVLLGRIRISLVDCDEISERKDRSMISDAYRYE